MKLTAAIASVLVALTVTLTAPATAAGNTYVYRVINAYNKETVGHLRQERSPVSTAQGEVVSVSVDNPALGMARTEIYAPQGQWLRRPLDNHGRPVEYEFAAALPAVQPHLPVGQSWSVRVPAKAAGESRNRSVRIDGSVLGQERIRVAAGEFDTVKVQRVIYAGDADFSITETRIVELDWYAPALGRSVRTETRSTWRDFRSGCRRPEHCDYRGDWFVFELAEAPAAARP